MGLFYGFVIYYGSIFYLDSFISNNVPITNNFKYIIQIIKNIDRNGKFSDLIKVLQMTIQVNNYENRLICIQYLSYKCKVRIFRTKTNQ